MFDLNDYWNIFYSFLSQNYSQQFIFVFISWLIFFIFYYLHSWFFILLSHSSFFDKYSIKSIQTKRINQTLKYQAIKEGTIDTFLLKPILLYFTYPFLSKPFISFEKVPSISKCLIDWLIMEFIFSTSLYFLHRLLHAIPFLYQHFHKKHHLFTTTISYLLILLKQLSQPFIFILQ